VRAEDAEGRRLVGSIIFLVSFAKEPYKRDDILQNGDQRRVRAKDANASSGGGGGGGGVTPNKEIFKELRQLE